MSSSNSSRRVALRPLLALAFAAGAVLAAPSALADEKFPPLVEQHLGMPCSPNCTICHKTTQGGFNTLRLTKNGRPGFGLNLRDTFGLDYQDPNSVARALDALAAAGPDKVTDVDGDGVKDIDELKACKDPNDPDPNATLLATGPEFGCVRVAKQGPVDGAGAALAGLVLAVGAAALRRRSR